MRVRDQQQISRASLTCRRSSIIQFPNFDQRPDGPSERQSQETQIDNLQYDNAVNYSQSDRTRDSPWEIRPTCADHVSIASLVSKDSVENDGDQGGGEDDHPSEETFDRSVTIDEKDILRRCFVRDAMTEGLADILPDQEEQLKRKTHYRHCDLNERTVKHIRLNSIVQGYRSGFNFMYPS